MEGVEKDHQRSRECPFLGRRRDRDVVYSYATLRLRSAFQSRGGVS